MKNMVDDEKLKDELGVSAGAFSLLAKARLVEAGNMDTYKAATEEKPLGNDGEAEENDDSDDEADDDADDGGKTTASTGTGSSAKAEGEWFNRDEVIGNNIRLHKI